MDVEVAKHAGFCFGVLNTIRKIEETLKTSTEPVWSIGLPVHNVQLTERLKEQGLRIAESTHEITTGILIVRAHGLPPQDMEALASRGVKIIDGTCPFVKKAQDTAGELSREGYMVVLCGEKAHPEVRSIEGSIAGERIICSSLDDIRGKIGHTRVALISQTTQSPQVFDSIAQYLSSLSIPDLKIVNTICQSVHHRKKFAAELAVRVDVMIIVGGKMSSNTKRLHEASLAVNPKSYLVEEQKEIDPRWFAGAKKVGVTAGASTPDWVIEDVVAWCQRL